MSLGGGVRGRGLMANQGELASASSACEEGKQKLTEEEEEQASSKGPEKGEPRKPPAAATNEAKDEDGELES